MPPDAIVMLKADHKEVRALFGEFQKSSTTEPLTRTQLREIGAEPAEAQERAPRRPEQPSALERTVHAVFA